MAKRWEGSTRAKRLPPGWKKLRERILERDGHRCTWILENEEVRCSEPATDVDHVDRLGGDDPSNLRALCGWHHRKKTAADASAARPKPPTQRRPAEQHPGLL